MFRRGLHPVVGYVCAVLVGSATFAVTAMLVQLSAYREFMTQYPQHTLPPITIMLITFLVATFIAFFSAALPVLLIHWIAKRWAISNVWYYVAGGVLTAVLLGSFSALSWALFMRLSPYASPDAPPLFTQAAYVAQFCVPSGIVSGLIYWLLTGRFVARGKGAP